MLHRPVSQKGRSTIWGCQRLVTLPDWQGLGLAMALIDAVSAEYAAVGDRVHTYPAHPSLVRTFDKSPNWKLEKKSGFTNTTKAQKKRAGTGDFGGRPCAVFEYCGPAAEEARLVA
jgi:GNAT superfamily N-acetyltransferase